MAYFQYPEDSHHYRNEWQGLLDYIRTEWPAERKADLGDLDHHIEAKALYVFTMSRRLIEEAENLASRKGWKPIFVEASILLFPMLELVGEARLGNEPNTGSWRRLASGIDWLIDPLGLPHRSSGTRNSFSSDESRVGTLGNYMSTLPTGPKARELFHLRNYHIHGLKNQPDQDFDIGAVQTCMNYELPCAIIEQSKVGLVANWEQLRNADGSALQDWITRLAEADIYPFGILGSPIYEKGLIDPDIVYWLDSLQRAGRQ
ncbi:MAG: hypothetical protein H8E35_03230 [Ardenticatenia bacterium]|nr:hypothetical protein [Ardenticatenia bacterium]